MKKSTASKVIIIPRPPSGGSTGSTTKSNVTENPETVNQTSAGTEADPVAEEPVKEIKSESPKEE